MRTNSSIYQSSPKGAYSLERLFRALEAGSLESEFLVGATVVSLSRHEGELVLASQGSCLRVSQVRDEFFEDLKEGCIIVLKGLRTHLLLRPSDKLGVSPESLVLRNPSELMVMTKPLAEHPLRFQPYIAKRWELFLDTVRKSLKQNQLLELRTPSLVPNPGMEPELEPFSTSFRLGSKEELYFLPTSQELHMKRLLASSFTDIFEIRSCFRNGELTPHHQPEFLMLEWYRAFGDLDRIIEDIKNLLLDLGSVGFERASLVSELKIISMRELFRQVLDFGLRPQTSLEEMRGLLQAFHIEFLPDDDWNELFHRIFLEKIDPWIANQKQPLLVYDFPPSLAALARLTPEGFADRFELYWGSLEIANAFHELNDPKEQRVRFVKDQKLRLQKGRVPLEIDEDFMRALEAGLPPSAGIALGLDRLFMALENLNDIRQTQAFSFD